MYIYGVGGVWVQSLECRGTRAPVILVLREFIWNATEVSLVLLNLEYTGSLGSPPPQVVHPPGSIVPP